MYSVAVDAEARSSSAELSWCLPPSATGPEVPGEAGGAH